jgi:non-lysosomal glucosylceramidase
MLQEGFEIIRSIADRYDGEKRNPYDEIEAGSHYARSMASFALFPAVAGFRFDMPAKRIGFDPLLEKNHFTGFFSLDTGWGQLMKTPNWAAIKVLYGVLSLMELDLPFAVNPQNVTTDGKDPVGFTVLNGIICLEQEVTIRAGESLVIRY